MTNEQLAAFIHQGGNDELRPLLWDKVKALVYMKAEQYYRGHASLCASHGVELWDIKQAGYMAFTEALEAYKPESEYKFITFLNFPFRNAVAALLGLRKKNPLDSCVSLDTPVNDEDNDTTLIELQPDSQSLDFVDKLEAAMMSEIILNEIEALPDKHAAVIKWYYLENKTLTEIGKLLGISPEWARQLKYHGERKLRKSRELRELYHEYYQQRYKPRWKYFDWQPEHCVLSRTR